MTRRKKCRGCKETFYAVNTLTVVCSPPCAIEYAREQDRKERRRDNRERKQALKTRSQFLKEAQVAFNAYIRERDRDKPCICCGRFTSDSDLITGSRWDAGHYRSVGAAPHLRFNEDNCHRQLVQCNRDRSGNAVEYRARLVDRIGLERVEVLEADQSEAKWTIDELKLIRDRYRRMARELKRENEKCSV